MKDETLQQPAGLLRPRLRELLDRVREGCTECGGCMTECTFLRRHGTPKSIAGGFATAAEAALSLPFECSLCGLCGAVCPEGLTPTDLFLEMRREAVDRSFGGFPEHGPLLSYERLGTSRRFTLYRLPEGCSTVFFPGCALSGSRPAGVSKVFSLLRQADPAMGIVFDCCMKPSHGLGRERYAHAMFEEMRNYLAEQGVREVLVACPNCREMFDSLGRGLAVRTVYEALAESAAPPEQASGTVTVHDPCVLRHDRAAQQAVRTLLRRQGLTVEEMAHSGRTTLCCGQGGGVNLLDPDLAGSWVRQRVGEASGRRVVGYCAACVQALADHAPASHLLDMLFNPQQALAGRVKGAAAPFSYLNRLLLKRKFRRMGGVAVLRERTFSAEPESVRKLSWKPFVLLALLAAAVAGVHLSGAGRYLQQDQLRGLIAGYGALAPAVYILIYSLAPVLFLPGLPITIAGGILFGPFWGVVYTITGATIGASLAFLTARYLARDWVASKLTGPGWARLDREVERHGWKVVAFTRLIPAFPFNLLNYAFGLTKIPFSHYLVATFFCMRPACIAFIVFSSSLLDLIRGNLSPTALVGIALVVAVSLIPLIYRRFKARRAAGGMPGEPD